MFPIYKRTKKDIKMSNYQYLHNYLKELRLKKHEKANLKRSISKHSLPDYSNTPLRQTKSLIIREKRVRYGLNKYNDPNTDIIKNELNVVNVNGKLYKETKIKKIKRNRIDPDNKLPVYDEEKRRKILSNLKKINN